MDTLKLLEFCSCSGTTINVESQPYASVGPCDGGVDAADSETEDGATDTASDVDSAD